MSILAGPLPEIAILLRALFRRPRNNILPCDYNKTNALRFYPRGRLALKEGVNILLKERGKEQGYIWFPAYFCNEAISPLREKKIKISFYPIDRELHPRWEELEELIKERGVPDVFVVVHYFGFANQIDETVKFCQRYNISVLEDAAHVFLPTSHVGNNHVTVYSPRKLLPIPEGGILSIPHEKQKNVTENNYNNNIFPVIKWIMRTIVKILIVHLRLPWHKIKNIIKSEPKEESLSKNNMSLENKCMLYSLQLLYLLRKDFDKIVQTRRHNYQHLYGLLRDAAGIKPLFADLPDDVCPYCFPFLIPDKPKDIIRILGQDYGVPAADWSDLAPEVIQERQKFQDAIWLAEHIVLLPVHQSIKQAQIIFISKKINELMNR